MPHQAEILAVGTELLLGNITNTNAQFLSELLASAGIDVLYHTAVGDNPQRLRAAVETARGRCDLLVFTGGLGPTYDDMTKETVAEAFGLALEYHPEVMEEIQCYFDNVFHRPMPACNRRRNGGGVEITDGVCGFCQKGQTFFQAPLQEFVALDIAFFPRFGIIL